MNRERDITQDECEALVLAMLKMPPWKDHMWARSALMIAARAIRRGRHLTDEERLDSLMKKVFER